MADTTEKRKNIKVSGEEIEEAVGKLPSVEAEIKELKAQLTAQSIAVSALSEKNTELQQSVTGVSNAIEKNAAVMNESIAINRCSVGLQCKNMLENNCTSAKVNGVTITVNADKSITLNGTNTGSSVLAFTNIQTGATSPTTQYDGNKKWLPTGLYKMSLEGSNGSVTLQMRCALQPNDQGTGYLTTGETIVEVTEEHNYVWNRLLISGGATFDNVTIYPMIRPVEISDSTYMPYTPSLQEQLNILNDRLDKLEGAV